MKPPEALVVDDEPAICSLIRMTLERMSIRARTAESLGDAKKLLAERPFDLCFTDMRLPDGNGLDLVRFLGRHYPELPVAVITAYGGMETAVEALKAGAFDFVSKPINLDNLRNLASTALKLGVTRGPGGDVVQLLGDTPTVRHLREMIGKVARSDAPVLIYGESGTGKELAARLIHARSPRREGPFVPVNCGAIPTELVESEFFGHRKGSFTGAVADKEGLFQAAAGGTLFLDEVVELPLLMQAKLLRAIQERAVRAVGDTREVPTDVRIVSATNQSLDTWVRDQRFREDLYYRIDVLQINAPSLREIPDDIPMLARHILDRLAANREPPALSNDALRALQGYSFPGNVRELENILERAFALCDGHTISAGDLAVADRTRSNGQVAPATPDREPAARGEDESLDAFVGRVERDAIETALRETGYNKTSAAKKLGISFRSLRYKLQKLREHPK